MRNAGRVLVGLGLGAALLALTAPAGAQQAAKPPVMQHTAQGRQQCLMCHGGDMQNIVAAPKATHEGRGNETCAWCHAPDAAIQTKAAAPVPHTLQGRDNCTMCHGGTMPNVKAVPAESHKGIDTKHCTMCHTPGAK